MLSSLTALSSTLKHKVHKTKDMTCKGEEWERSKPFCGAQEQEEEKRRRGEGEERRRREENNMVRERRGGEEEEERRTIRYRMTHNPVTESKGQKGRQ